MYLLYSHQCKLEEISRSLIVYTSYDLGHLPLSVPPLPSVRVNVRFSVEAVNIPEFIYNRYVVKAKSYQ